MAVVRSRGRPVHLCSSRCLGRLRRPGRPGRDYVLLQGGVIDPVTVQGVQGVLDEFYVKGGVLEEDPLQGVSCDQVSGVVATRPLVRVRIPSCPVSAPEHRDELTGPGRLFDSGNL